MADRTTADSNLGNLNQPQNAGSLATIGTPKDSTYAPSKRYPSITPPMTIPSTPYNKAQRISRYITVGEALWSPMSDQIPPDQYRDIASKIQLLCYNVLDRIREYHDFDILSIYRIDSTEHGTGLAADITSPSYNPHKNVAIAEYAQQYLPVSQVHLERTKSGRTIVHLKVVQPTNKLPNPTVLTYTDTDNTVSVEGIVVDLVTKTNSR